MLLPLIQEINRLFHAVIIKEELALLDFGPFLRVADKLILQEARQLNHYLGELLVELNSQIVNLA